MDYKNANDYELIYLINDSNEDAYYGLYEKYLPLIKKLAKELYLKFKRFNLEYDDLYQEGMYGLYDAVKNFKDNDGTIFSSVAYIYIKRYMLRIVSNANRVRKMSLYNTYSIERQISASDLTLGDVIYNIEDEVDYIFNNRIYEQKIRNDILSLESDYSCILELKYNGFRNIEISILLDLPYKKIDNALRKIKKFIINNNN